MGNGRIDNELIDRTVEAYQLVNAGYELRDGYFVQTIGDREVRFIEVAHGRYIFDGESECRMDLRNEPTLFDDNRE
jgi:hypothetical protein